MASRRFSPIPSTFLSSAVERKLPFSSRYAMMRWARTSPMPGSAVSCSVSARLMSMGNVTATVSGVVGSGRVVWGGKRLHGGGNGQLYAAVIAVSAQKEAKGEYGEKKGYGDQNAEPWFFHGNLPPGLTRGGKAVIISPSLYTTFHRRTSPVKKY